MPINQLPTKGDKNWGDTLNSWLGQLGPASLGGIHNGDTASRPAGLTVDDEGRIYIDTESQELLNWDGSAWQILLTGNVEQKFNITAKTADYTITPAEAETGLNGFSNDGASGIVKFTLPDAVAGMKVTIINSEDQTLQIEKSGDDKIYTTTITAGTELLITTTKASTTELYCINGTEWITSGVVTQWLNGGGKGYFGGSAAVIDGIVFSTLTKITTSINLASNRVGVAGFNSIARGYFGGGGNAGALTITYDVVDGIVFIDETHFTSVNGLSVARSLVAGLNSTTSGYIGGGRIVGDTSLNEIDSIVYADESQNNIIAVLSIARDMLSGINSTINGYFGGGATDGTVGRNTIDGLNFSTEAAINPTAFLPSTNFGLTGVNSTTSGYFAGGWNGTAKIDRIDSFDFSTETITGSVATLTSVRQHLAGCNNSVYGYFSSDHVAVDTVNTLDFATDTIQDTSITCSNRGYTTAGVQSGGIL